MEDLVYNWKNLLRTRQWYKNLLVFLALFFSDNLFNPQLLLTCIIAFISLCAISSASYIINDLVDLNFDKKHPHKSKRPLATGNISRFDATKAIIILLLFSFLLASIINIQFTISILILFLLTTAYTFYLKRYFLVDIITISLLFVIRAVSGAFAIEVWVSPWLIICPFFLAILLVASKRYANKKLLGSNAVNTKPVLGKYTLKNTKKIMLYSTYLFVASYTIYTIISNRILIITIPLAILTILRYRTAVFENYRFALDPKESLKDNLLRYTSLTWVIISLFLLYML